MIMDKIALVLAIIGGLNWGSIGIFGFDIVAFLFGGSGSAISRVIYTLVHLSAFPRYCSGRRAGLRLRNPRTLPGVRGFLHVARSLGAF